MKVYTDTVQFRKQDDGSYTISVAVNDTSLCIKVLNKRDVVKIIADVQKLLAEE